MKTVVACMMVLLPSLPGVIEENLENVSYFPFLLAEMQIQNPQNTKQNAMQETVMYSCVN